MFWKQKVSAKFWAISSKVCGNRTFAQNLHTRKLGETTVFYAVSTLVNNHAFETNLQTKPILHKTVGLDLRLGKQ